jgi:ribulose-phosphate 3-epimerase
MKVVPAILAETFNDFLLRIGQAERFTNYVQIDVMDGRFVPTRSFSPEKINGRRTSLSFEIHLMVKDPSVFMAQIDSPRLAKVLYHFESEVNHLEFIRQMEERGIKTGLAIKPETQVSTFREIVPHVETLMFLTVDPCCYGHPFKPEVLKKIEEAKNTFPEKRISVDGGVSLDKLKTFMDLGVDYVCVGSRIFLEGNPEGNYRRFIQRVRELGAH